MSGHETSQVWTDAYELLDHQRSHAALAIEGLGIVVKDEAKITMVRELISEAEALEEGADGSFLGQKPAIMAAFAYRAAAKVAEEDLLLH